MILMNIEKLNSLNWPPQPERVGSCLGSVCSVYQVPIKIISETI